MTDPPAMYSTEISHLRTSPVTYRFRHRSVSWFLDVDDLTPVARWLRPLVSFRARDHLSPPDAGPDTLRARVDAELRRHAIAPRPGRVTVLLNARAVGYVFDPLTLFWCHATDGSVYAVLAEVHNTYGGRHCYVVVPDDAGRASVDKAFYVSPFNTVDGHYSMHVVEPADTVRVAITWHPDTGSPFHARLHGTRTAITTRAVLAAQLRAPLAPLVVSARIRQHGVALWRKRLAIVPRPPITRPIEEKS